MNLNVHHSFFHHYVYPIEVVSLTGHVQLAEIEKLVILMSDQFSTLTF